MAFEDLRHVAELSRLKDVLIYMSPTASTGIMLTTAVLIIYVVLASLQFPFAWVFLLLTVLTGLLIWMVLSILKDTSDPVTKKFEDQLYLDREK
ncbi:MAG: hypothetical protein AB7K37_12365 [Cyclobacteriaceae bacterium]